MKLFCESRVDSVNSFLITLEKKKVGKYKRKRFTKKYLEYFKKHLDASLHGRKQTLPQKAKKLTRKKYDIKRSQTAYNNLKQKCKTLLDRKKYDPGLASSISL